MIHYTGGYAEQVTCDAPGCWKAFPIDAREQAATDGHARELAEARDWECDRGGMNLDFCPVFCPVLTVLPRKVRRRTWQ